MVGLAVSPTLSYNQALLAETFRRLELDCYNADLQIAVEYQGRQHYDGSDPSIARRDAYKVKQCIDRGVALVVVLYWVNVEDFLEREFAHLEGTPLTPAPALENSAR